MELKLYIKKNYDNLYKDYFNEGCTSDDNGLFWANWWLGSTSLAITHAPDKQVIYYDYKNIFYIKYSKYFHYRENKI